MYQDDYGSAIGVLHGTRPGRTLIFDGHLDVVPVNTPELWTHPPFGGEFDGVRIWGRGACDMKGSLAAFVCALGHLPRDAFAGRIIVSAGVGEEMIEGMALAELLKQHPADFVVIGEPTSFCLGIGHKGRAGLQIVTTGVPAHTSHPERGVNAVYRMIEAITRIREIDLPKDEILGQGVNELVDIISSPYPGTSMVPSGCQARFDRRLVRGETKESVLRDMRQAVAGLQGVEVNFHQARLTCYTAVSVQVDDFGSPASFEINDARDYERNTERYAFLRWGQQSFRNFRVVPPNTGIVHQVNLENLAPVVFRREHADGTVSLYPDTVVGTDSHTTMINGVGVLGWGVGGIEAEAAMLGQPITMLIPQVVGFKLSGKMREGVTATDLVLTIVEMLRQKGVVGKFVEFYGDGLDHLSLADQATIALNGETNLLVRVLYR